MMTQSALDAEQLVDQVRNATGLEDFGELAYREGLDVLVSALNREAALNEIGVQVATAEITSYLTNRLVVTDWVRKHPSIEAADIVPPIVIVGQGRTGTTILFDLLAQDPAHRVPVTWEVDRPFPPPQTATFDSDPRIAEVQAQLDMSDLLVPDLKSMHPMGARLAQECVRITGADFRSMIFPTQYRIPSYATWLLDEADMAPAYRWHRRFLQYLQSGHRRERWVLKSPGHVWCLPELLAEYPRALLVQTHRDPLRIIASLSSLIATLRRLASDDTSIPSAAAEFADLLLDGLDRSVFVREAGILSPRRVVDVQFDAFMADPFATIRTIYERLGLELTAEAEGRMRAFLAANPSDKHGGHTYTWQDTGLDEGVMRARARHYQEYFDVPSERLR